MKKNGIPKKPDSTFRIESDYQNIFTEIIEHQSISHEEVLDKILTQIVPIDFLVLANPILETIREGIKVIESKPLIENGEFGNSPHNQPKQDELKELKENENKYKVAKDAIVVLAIENILNVAKLNQWNLCKNGDFIYLYNGEFWKVIEKDELKVFLGKAGEKMGIPILQARYFKFKDLLFEQFMSATYMSGSSPDTSKVYINLKNGTFEIDALKRNILRPFDSKDFLKYQLPFSYDPEAKAPIFNKYIERVLPNEDTRNVLSEYLGYIFIRHNSSSIKLEKVLLLYGTGANGKSVLFEIINALLGPENVSNFSISSLTTEQNGHYRAMIHNKLLNYASEINGKMESALFKQIASGEPISARLLYGNPIIISDYAKLIFNCNELPKEVEHSVAFYRRFLIIPFNVTIPECEQDRQLHSKIIECELAGVFNWMLKGLERLLLQKDFTVSTEVQNALEIFKKESDSVHMFLDENGYKPHPDSHELLQTLYADYRISCINDGNVPVSKKNLSKRLKLLGYTIQRRNVGMVIFCYKG